MKLAKCLFLFLHFFKSSSLTLVISKLFDIPPTYFYVKTDYLPSVKIDEPVNEIIKYKVKIRLPFPRTDKKLKI